MVSNLECPEEAVDLAVEEVISTCASPRAALLLGRAEACSRESEEMVAVVPGACLVAGGFPTAKTARHSSSQDKGGPAAAIRLDNTTTAPNTASPE